MKSASCFVLFYFIFIFIFIFILFYFILFCFCFVFVLFGFGFGFGFVFVFVFVLFCFVLFCFVLFCTLVKNKIKLISISPMLSVKCHVVYVMCHSVIVMCFCRQDQARFLLSVGHSPLPYTHTTHAHAPCTAGCSRKSQAQGKVEAEVAVCLA